jgi:hypothetical protein
MNDKEEAVQMRAYQLWEKDGRPEGQAFEHWLQAERELDADWLALEQDHHDGRLPGDGDMPVNGADQIVEVMGDPVRRGRAGK